MTRDEITADQRLVSKALGIALLLAQGTVKPDPADITTMHEGRDAFARLRIEMDALHIVARVENLR